MDANSIEQLVKEAGSEISETVDENLMIQEAMFAGQAGEDESDAEPEFMTEDEIGTPEEAEAADDTKNTDKKTGNDAKIIKELEDAEQQAMETAKIIYELKERVAQLLNKEKMTESEAKELEEIKKQLNDQMVLFEAKTKKIQELIDQASMYEDMMSLQPVEKHNEDMLPKLIICGHTEHNMPKLIICNDKKKSRKDSRGGSGYSYSPSSKHKPSSIPCPDPCSVEIPQFAEQLSKSINQLEKLVAEKAHLEDKRCQLQEDLMHKDHTVDNLQRKLESLQGHLQMVCKENCLLSQTLHRLESGCAPRCQTSCNPPSCGSPSCQPPCQSPGCPPCRSSPPSCRRRSSNGQNKGP